MVTIQQGRRPSRPSHDLGRIRGMSDALWDLVTACWCPEPSERPSASQVVKAIRAMPDRQVDHRPCDCFESHLPRILDEAHHPLFVV